MPLDGTGATEVEVMRGAAFMGAYCGGCTWGCWMEGVGSFGAGAANGRLSAIAAGAGTRLADCLPATVAAEASVPNGMRSSVSTGLAPARENEAGGL